MRLPAAVKKWLGSEGIERVFDLFEHHRDCPEWHDHQRKTSRPISKAELFEPNAKGKTFLDNPYNWDQMASWVMGMREEGEYLTLDDLRQTNSEGITYLEQAARSGQIDAVVTMLAARGEYLQKSDLLDENNRPSGVMRAAAAWNQLGSLFTFDQWQNQSYDALLQTLRALPADVQADIKTHGLLAAMRREESQLHKGEGRKAG